MKLRHFKDMYLKLDVVVSFLKNPAFKPTLVSPKKMAEKYAGNMNAVELVLTKPGMLFLQ